jgi:hypothetical protein
MGVAAVVEEATVAEAGAGAIAETAEIAGK